MEETNQRNSASLAPRPETDPMLPVVMFLLLVAGLCLRVKPLLDDLDVGWLVRTGELLWQTGKLPAADIFSFSWQGQPWVLYQWGFEFLLGGLYRLAGLGGVVWGAAVFIALTYALLFAFLLRLGLPSLPAMGLTGLAMFVNNLHWYARPGIFTVLGYVVILWWLENERLSPGRKIWVLPLFFVIWANLHLGFVWGLLVVLIYGAWAYGFPEAFRGPGAARDPSLLIVCLLCLVASCINPYGPGLFSYLWRLSLATTMNGSIIELQSPNFHQFIHQSFYIGLFIQLCLLIWVNGPGFAGRPVLLTLVTLGLGMGLYSARHLPLFSITATVYLGYAFRARLTPVPCGRLSWRGFLWGGAGLALSLVLVIGIKLWRPGFYRFDAAVVPQQAASYLLTKVDASRPVSVFSNDAQWLSYLIYAGSPHLRVFIDSRFDMYGEAFFKRYLSLKDKAFKTPEILIPLQVDYLLINKDKLTTFPPEGPGVRLVYEDPQSRVYRLDQASSTAPPPSAKAPAAGKGTEFYREKSHDY